MVVVKDTDNVYVLDNLLSQNLYILKPRDTPFCSIETFRINSNYINNIFFFTRTR